MSTTLCAGPSSLHGPTRAACLTPVAATQRPRTAAVIWPNHRVASSCCASLLPTNTWPMQRESFIWHSCITGRFRTLRLDNRERRSYTHRYGLSASFYTEVDTKPREYIEPTPHRRLRRWNHDASPTRRRWRSRVILPSGIRLEQTELQDDKHLSYGTTMSVSHISDTLQRHTFPETAHCQGLRNHSSQAERRQTLSQTEESKRLRNLV